MVKIPVKHAEMDGGFSLTYESNLGNGRFRWHEFRGNGSLAEEVLFLNPPTVWMGEHNRHVPVKFAPDSLTLHDSRLKETLCVPEEVDHEVRIDFE